ncbi:MAG: hypothetical protein AAF467_27745 [Actinomycetota bacterium]
MTGRAAQRKGAKAERDVAAYLNQHGFPHARRRANRGQHNDIGDIAELGPGLVIEVKDRVKASPAAWLAQLATEMAAAGADQGAVIYKRAGTTNVADWHALLPVGVYVRLLREAGYGDPIEAI